MIAIRLGQQSLTGSSNLPASLREQRNVEAYLVLLRVEFTLLRTVASRTVRSYRTLSPLPVPLRAIGGLLSVALVVGLRLPGVTWHPALWSPDFPPLCQSPEGRQRLSPEGIQRQPPEGHQQSSDYPVNSEADCIEFT